MKAEGFLERVQRDLADAAGIIPVIAEGQIELRHVDEDRRLMSFVTLDFEQAGVLIDALNEMRKQLVFHRGFAHAGHA